MKPKLLTLAAVTLMVAAQSEVQAQSRILNEMQPPVESSAPLIINTSSTTAPYSRAIEGTVQQLEPNYLIVREFSGRDVRLHFDNTTRIDQNIRVGDRVVVMTNGVPSDTVYATGLYRPDLTQVVQGHVTQTDDNWYTLKDANGNDLRIQVDNTTKLSRNIKAGDEIVAVNTMPATSPYETSVYTAYRRDSTTPIQGEVVRSEDDWYVVRDITGREVLVQKRVTTIRSDNVYVGDRVVAYASPMSTLHAESIVKR